jgi:hypothetical protein
MVISLNTWVWMLDVTMLGAQACPYISVHDKTIWFWGRNLMNPPQKKSHDPTPLPPTYDKANNVFVRRYPYFPSTVQFKQGSSYTNRHNKIMCSGWVERRIWNEFEVKTWRRQQKRIPKTQFKSQTRNEKVTWIFESEMGIVRENPKWYIANRS